MNITFERAARDVKPGQTVLCKSSPAVVWRTFADVNTGMVFIIFFTPNAENFIQMVREPNDMVTIAPLAQT